MLEKIKILISTGTSGISAGALEVAENFYLELKRYKLSHISKIIKTGDRGLFRDVLVDIITDDLKRTVYEYVKPEDVSTIVQSHILNGQIVERLQAGEDYRQFFSNQLRIVLSNCGEIDPENIAEYIEFGGYKGLAKALSMSPEEVVEEIKKSLIRGRGGAGFPAGLKWEFAKKYKSETKYVICNADEGDPGAFMDRSVLEGDPHSVIEGMIIAGYAIGANHGYIYCRAEYPLAIKRINIALSQAKKKGFLGKNIIKKGFSFDITIKEGAGAFVCGEETALIASIEGERGMPVPRPPFPAESGLHGKPTIINNVETLANIRHIINKGSEWFLSIGTEKSRGTKVFALAGKVKNTGLVEVAMGMTLRELIYNLGGGMANKNRKFKGVQIGGPSGGCLPERLLDTPIDYESITETGAIMGSGGMVVMDESTCMVDMAKFFLDFTVAESCGKCVPCRVGLKRMQEAIGDITEGRAKQGHIDFLESMGSTIKETALCGLGNTAPNPVLTTLKYFLNEYKTHINDRICSARVCVKLVRFEVVSDNCIKCGLCFKACPLSAVEWKKGEYARIDKDKCIKCKACINICPVMAIE